MNGTFAKVSADALDSLQYNAGVILKQFTPSASATLVESDIVCATTGGINVSAVPTYVDFGADIDNVANNTKELKHIESWEIKLTFTALDCTDATLKLALGAADYASNKLTLRSDVASSDFADIWWVGDLLDGGLVAVKIKNALSSGGMKLQTTKNGKGQLSVELTGHISINDTDEVPMEVYVYNG